MPTGRVAVLEAPGRVRIQEVPVPEPGPTEVLVRLEGCGVCGSDLPLWEGRPWFEYPRGPGAPGHEGWGRVVATGAQVRTVHPGDRVALLSFQAYGEYDVAPEESVVPLSARLEGLPFPGEAVGCAMNVLARSRIEPGTTVAILGIGFLGAVLTSLCARAGARVLAASRRPFALDLARSLGAAETIPLDDHEVVLRRFREATEGHGCDRVIEATGKQWPLDLGGELCGERGTLVIAGYHQDGPRQVNMQLWNWRGLDVINAHERDPRVYARGLRTAVEAAASGSVDLRRLCTHTFRLEELPRAFETACARPDGFLKAVVVP